ncbi:MAG: hypothetical protein HY287_05005 [Planctomycetes bacterium]|nr:hypothetical protein [Planctomycetota bacterium]
MDVAARLLSAPHEWGGSDLENVICDYPPSERDGSEFVDVAARLLSAPHEWGGSDLENVICDYPPSERDGSEFVDEVARKGLFFAFRALPC